MTETQLIPVTIITFDDKGTILYKAYSPIEYHSNETQKFLVRVYDLIAYNFEDPQDKETIFGQLKDIYTKDILIPISERGNLCYFSTDKCTTCPYNVVHKHSPILFNDIQARNYGNTQPNLKHRVCDHELI
jgi:hypothetical protein